MSLFASDKNLALELIRRTEAIYYGLKQDRIQLMNMIYELRAERLNKSGIHIDQMDFVQMAL